MMAVEGKTASQCVDKKLSARKHKDKTLEVLDGVSGRNGDTYPKGNGHL